MPAALAEWRELIFRCHLVNLFLGFLVFGAQGVIVCESTWPSIGRTVYNNHQRYIKTYMSDVPGTYFFGDSASRDEDGHYWIQGRCDGMCLRGAVPFPWLRGWRADLILGCHRAGCCTQT